MDTIIIENEISGYDGVLFTYDLRFKPANESRPLVVFCHGFKGFKDWGHWHLIADYFTENGFSFAKMNYSHNGTTGRDSNKFDELDKFAKNTYSAELYDLNVFLRHLIHLSEMDSNGFSFNEIHLIGHSRSGPIVLRASTAHSLVKSVVTWASVHSLSYMWERPTFNLDEWLKNGVHKIMNGRTKQWMSVDIKLYHDYMANEEILLIENIAQEVNIPVLILHGDSDPAVDSKAAYQLDSKLTKSRVEIIENGDHVFGGRHPYKADGLPKQSVDLCQRTIEFLKKG